MIEQPIELSMQIKVTNLSKSFEPGQKILSDINFSVNKGEILTILGPSGCGKSTILRILAGLDKPDSGNSEVNDSISFVFQQPLLLEWRTALENVMIPLELAGKKNVSKAMECLELVGLTGNSGKYPDQLSGGMKMRVSLARALVTEPQIMLLDEPFAALDEMTRERLNEELLNLRARKNMTVLFVTHNIFEAVFISDKIIILGGEPAGIHEIIEVPLPNPRDISIRGSTDFAVIVGKVQESLRGTLK